MDHVRLGKTEIVVNKNGFGVLPLQRVEKPEAVNILRKAFANGINFYDTARAYSDSEEKIGLALADVRDQLFIATKTTATPNGGGVLERPGYQPADAQNRVSGYLPVP